MVIEKNKQISQTNAVRQNMNKEPNIVVEIDPTMLNSDEEDDDTMVTANESVILTADEGSVTKLRTGSDLLMKKPIEDHYRTFEEECRTEYSTEYSTTDHDYWYPVPLKTEGDVSSFNFTVDDSSVQFTDDEGGPVIGAVAKTWGMIWATFFGVTGTRPFTRSSSRQQSNHDTDSTNWRMTSTKTHRQTSSTHRQISKTHRQTSTLSKPDADLVIRNIHTDALKADPECGLWSADENSMIKISEIYSSFRNSDDDSMRDGIGDDFVVWNSDNNSDVIKFAKVYSSSNNIDDESVKKFAHIYSSFRKVPDADSPMKKVPEIPKIHVETKVSEETIHKDTDGSSVRNSDNGSCMSKNDPSMKIRGGDGSRSLKNSIGSCSLKSTNCVTSLKSETEEDNSDGITSLKSAAVEESTTKCGSGGTGKNVRHNVRHNVSYVDSFLNKTDNEFHMNGACKVLHLKLQNNIRKTQVAREGTYHLQGKINDRNFWVKNDQSQGIWYVPEFQDWAVGSMDSFDSKRCAITTTGGLGTRYPYDEQNDSLWKYATDQGTWESANTGDVTLTCKDCCKTIEVKLENEVKKKQSCREGTYHPKQLVNERNYWIKEDNTQGIWYLPEYKDWAIGPMDNMKSKRCALTTTGGLGTVYPYDERNKCGWRYATDNGTWETAPPGDVKLTCRDYESRGSRLANWIQRKVACGG